MLSTLLLDPFVKSFDLKMMYFLVLVCYIKSICSLCLQQDEMKMCKECTNEGKENQRSNIKTQHIHRFPFALEAFGF